MKRVAMAVCLSVMALGFVGAASAKMPWKKDLGAESCDTCHKAGAPKSTANPDNKIWAASKDMAAKMKEGKGDFAGKTSCGDCHKGKMKP